MALLLTYCFSHCVKVCNPCVGNSILYFHTEAKGCEAIKQLENCTLVAIMWENTSFYSFSFSFSFAFFYLKKQAIRLTYLCGNVQSNFEDCNYRFYVSLLVSSTRIERSLKSVVIFITRVLYMVLFLPMFRFFFPCLDYFLLGYWAFVQCSTIVGF